MKQGVWLAGAQLSFCLEQARFQSQHRNWLRTPPAEAGTPNGGCRSGDAEEDGVHIPPTQAVGMASFSQNVSAPTS
jgi:hypothetical protein